LNKSGEFLQVQEIIFLPFRVLVCQIAKQAPDLKIRTKKTPFAPSTTTGKGIVMLHRKNMAAVADWKNEVGIRFYFLIIDLGRNVEFQ
jgi:hypothetical protein